MTTFAPPGPPPTPRERLERAIDNLRWVANDLYWETNNALDHLFLSHGDPRTAQAREYLKELQRLSDEAQAALKDFPGGKA